MGFSLAARFVQAFERQCFTSHILSLNVFDIYNQCFVMLDVSLGQLISLVLTFRENSLAICNSSFVGILNVLLASNKLILLHKTVLVPIFLVHSAGWLYLFRSVYIQPFHQCVRLLKPEKLQKFKLYLYFIIVSFRKVSKSGSVWTLMLLYQALHHY